MGYTKFTDKTCFNPFGGRMRGIDSTINSNVRRHTHIMDKPVFYARAIYFDIELDWALNVGSVVHVVGDDECRSYHVICKEGMDLHTHRMKRADGCPPDWYDGRQLIKGRQFFLDGYFFDSNEKQE